MFTGLKLAASYTVIGVIASEFIQAESGVGWFVGFSYNNFAIQNMYAAILLILAFAVLVNSLLLRLERRIWTAGRRCKTAGTTSRRGARRAPTVRPVRPAALPLVLLAIWQVVGMLAGDFYVATPVQAADALADGVSGGWFFDSLGATLAATALGFAIAAVAGLWIGVTLGLVRFWGNVFEPITLSVYSIPKVTLFPIFLTVFGFGLYSKIAFGMFHGIFPIVIIAMSATREVNPVHLKVARSLRLSRAATFRQVIFPAIFPSLLTGPAARLLARAARRGAGRDVRLAGGLRLRAGRGDHAARQPADVRDHRRARGDRVRGQRAVPALGARRGAQG